MRSNFPYVSGKWLAICDRCGFKSYNTDLRPDGEKPNLMVCSRCRDVRSPLNDAHVAPTVQSVPWSRPEREDVFRFVDSDDYANRITPESYPKGF
jgi:hypothetical protein